MSVCRVRLILWLIFAATTVIGGIVTDLVLRTEPFPAWLRIVGVMGMVMMHYPLKRTGRLLSRLGEPEEWGCTSKLITTDIYGCLRHPHHLFIGIFMTSLGLAVGHIWSFILIAVPHWMWVFGFLFLVEERELLGKFGQDYADYRLKVPMLLPKLGCLYEVLSTPFESLRETSSR